MRRVQWDEAWRRAGGRVSVETAGADPHASGVVGDESLGAGIEDEAERGTLRVGARERSVDRLPAEDEMFLGCIDDGVAGLEPELEVALAVVNAVRHEHLRASRADEHDVGTLVIRLRLADGDDRAARA